jgi:ATP-dependent helicase/nuclease subunit B
MRRLESRLVAEVRGLRERDPRGALLLVVPSRLLGSRLRARLARALGGVAGIHVVTLPELAERVALLPLALDGRQPLPSVADRLLVDRAIRGTVPPAGGYFSEVRGARNFPSAMLRTLLDVKRAGLEPVDLEAAFPDSPKIRELAGVYRQFESALRQHRYYDASDLLAETARLVSAEPDRLGSSAVLAFGFVELNALEARLLAACDRAGTVVRYDADADAAELPAPGAIEIVAAPGEEREVREIARVILGHLDAGGRLDEVGVLLRQPASYLAQVRDVFTAAGIPYTQGTAPAIGEIRAGRSLRLLADVRRSDFARATVMEFLAFADLRSRPGTSPAEWERLSRQAGIVGGAREWRERLDRLGRRLEPAPEAEGDEEGAARRAGDRDALGALRRAARVLLRGLSRLPDPAPVDALVDAFTRTFRRLVVTSPEAELALGALGRLRELATVDAGVPLEEFWSLLEAALAVPSAPGPEPTPGRVFVGELGATLGIDFPLTIVPGLVEGSFPAAPRQDPILLDAERRRMTGLPLSEEARALERVRFALAVGSGARRVVLTYPRVDAESGRPRVPSFLVLDLLESVTGQRHDFESLERFPGWRTVPLHPAPPSAWERPLDQREWLVTRALAARATEPDALLRELPGARRGLEAIRSRERTDALTAYDGLLGQGVDLGEAPLAPTALERYAVCPFRFLLERVYRLEAVAEPDRILMIDPRDRGDLAHAVLEATFRLLAEGGTLPLTRERLPAAQDAFSAAFEEASAAAERRGVTGLPMLWAGERARLREELWSAIEAEADDPSGWRPALFEVAFGIEGREESAPPLVYRLPDGTTLHLRGRIDRVDVSPDGRRARVLDYKTGRLRSLRTADRLAKGRALQLPIYRLAADALLADRGPVTVDEAQYYHVIGPDAGTRVRFTRDGWESRRADFDLALATILGGIRAGRFFQRPSACARGPCAFDLACGAERARWADAKRADPAVTAHETLDTIE